MDENRESQELAIPGKIVKSEHKGGIAQTVRNILRKPASQAITKAPTEQTPPVEQTPGAMSVERAREILKYIVMIPEQGLDAHERERNLSPKEQLKRFGGIHYEDIKKAFGVYADHLVTTHGAKEPNEYYRYQLLKENLPGPPQITYEGELEKERYYDLGLRIMLNFERRKTPDAVRLTLYDGKRHGGMDFPGELGFIRVESQIPLLDTKDVRVRSGDFYDDLISRPIHPGFKTRTYEHFSLEGLRLYAKNMYDPELFHREYKGLHRGMRWTAANLLRWDEDKIIYPDDLDKPPFNKEQAQLNKPKLALPPKQ